MMRTFGKPEPSLLEALRRNPTALLEHFWWNLSLVPNGLQVLLFNATAGKVNPDYAPVNSGRSPPLIYSAVFFVIIVLGSVQLYKNRHHWWPCWLKTRVWGWIAMMCVSFVVVLVMIVQRPRPSYMFNLSFLLMAALGTCTYALVARSSVLSRFSKAFPIVVFFLLVLVPSYYGNNEKLGDRPLLGAYRRLVPYRDIIGTNNTVFVTPGYSFDLCSYLRAGAQGGCEGVYLYGLLDRAQRGSPLSDVLDGVGANLLYVDENVLGREEMQLFLSDCASGGWQTLVNVNVPGSRWMLLQR